MSKHAFAAPALSLAIVLCIAAGAAAQTEGTPDTAPPPSDVAEPAAPEANPDEGAAPDDRPGWGTPAVPPEEAAAPEPAADEPAAATECLVPWEAEPEGEGEDLDEGPNRGRIALIASLDLVSASYFHGIKDEFRRVILQPYLEMDVTLHEGEEGEPIDRIDLVLWTWSSVHSRRTFATHAPEAWYEADVYAGLRFSVLQMLELWGGWVAYSSPNGAFPTLQRLVFEAYLDDEAWLGPWALNPSVELDVELVGQDDSGEQRGVYFQIGIAPEVTIERIQDFDLGVWPVTISFPLVAGFSLYQYYEDASGDDDHFGFVQATIQVSVPLPFVPSDYGSWSVRAAISGLFMNQNLEEDINGDPHPARVIGIAGIDIEY